MKIILNFHVAQSVEHGTSKEGHGFNYETDQMCTMNAMLSRIRYK